MIANFEMIAKFLNYPKKQNQTQNHPKFPHPRSFRSSKWDIVILLIFYVTMKHKSQAETKIPV